MLAKSRAACRGAETRVRREGRSIKKPGTKGGGPNYGGFPAPQAAYKLATHRDASDNWWVLVEGNTFAVRHKGVPPSVGDVIDLVPISSDYDLLKGRVLECNAITQTYSAVFIKT